MREHAAEGPAPEATEDVVTTLAPPAPLSAPPLTVQGLLGIQRHAGNRAAAALVARQPTATKDGTLAMGATGSAVTALQMHLNLLDEVKTELVTDGIYGPITTSAVRQFQSAHPPLKATGAADAETQAAIAEAMKEDQNQEDIGRKLFALGGRSYERGKYGHAYAFFTRAGELADRPGITFSRAQALRRLGGRREEAIALYEQYLATGHGVRDADANAALKELKTPDKTGDKTTDDATARASSTRAERSTRPATTPTPTTSSARRASSPTARASSSPRAQALRRLGGRREEAIALYEQYLARGDGARKADAEAALKELRAPEATGDEDKDTATAKGIFNKGGALFEKGDYGHAYDEFTRASELADRPGILFSRAQALRKLGGREAEAMALYQQYIDLGEGSRLEDAKQMLELLQSHGAAP